jgi:hypothetical protein
MLFLNSEAKMQADKVLAAIQNELGNPSSGPFVDYWPMVEKAVRESLDPQQAGKQTRVIKASETPEGFE